MINESTILILGAGASNHLGLPVGKELGDSITNKLAGAGNPEFQQLLKLDFSAGLIEQFRESYIHSGKPSIDAFLEHRPEFMAVGKAAISQVLMPLENPEALFHSRDNWYEYLYGKMNAPFGQFGKNRLAVIHIQL